MTEDAGVEKAVGNRDPLNELCVFACAPSSLKVKWDLKEHLLRESVAEIKKGFPSCSIEDGVEFDVGL